jgi:hypothetical protein
MPREIFKFILKKRVLKSGEISKYNVGYGFHVSLHLRELSLIRKIHSKLNVGVVYSSDSKCDARLAVNDIAGLLKICKFFELNSLLTYSQLTRFLLLK